ncbi:MAG: formylmethanofuran dehydrogenase subunit C, partial [Methanosarcinales archaeon]|nr:formylmethanofuran dehydrogenase subunit C [Methanosarcinales archaeon]
MRTITIRPALMDGVPVEAERITPDILAGLSLKEMEDLEAWHGNRRLRMADLFEISADSGPASPEETTLVLDGDFTPVKRIGEKMTAGLVEIRGSAGMHTGNNMRGGEIRIQGDAGDWL